MKLSFWLAHMSKMIELFSQWQRLHSCWQSCFHTGKTCFTWQTLFSRWQNCFHAGTVAFTLAKSFSHWQSPFHAGKVVFTQQHVHFHGQMDFHGQMVFPRPNGFSTAKWPNGLRSRFPRPNGSPGRGLAPATWSDEASKLEAGSA